MCVSSSVFPRPDVCLWRPAGMKSSLLSTLFFEMASFTEPRPHWLARLAAQQAQGLFSFLPLHSGVADHTQLFNWGAGDLNSCFAQPALYLLVHPPTQKMRVEDLKTCFKAFQNNILASLRQWVWGCWGGEPAAWLTLWHMWWQQRTASHKVSRDAHPNVTVSHTHTRRVVFTVSNSRIEWCHFYSHPWILVEGRECICQGF